jgi:hypothetical protein
MAQLLDPPPSNRSDKIVCCYVNATSKIQVGRISNIPNWYFERVVFPGQRLIFETVPEAQLEIHTGMMASAILSDTISCRELWVEEVEPSPLPTPEFQQRVEEMNEGKQVAASAEIHAENAS